MPKLIRKSAKLFDKLGVYIIGNCRHEQEKLIRHGFPANRITYTYNALHKADYVPEKPPKTTSCSARCRAWIPSALCM